MGGGAGNWDWPALTPTVPSRQGIHALRIDDSTGRTDEDSVAVG